MVHEYIWFIIYAVIFYQDTKFQLIQKMVMFVDDSSGDFGAPIWTIYVFYEYSIKFLKQGKMYD